MWWQDLFMGYWNGVTAWIILIAHVFGGWAQLPLYDLARSGNWYDVGFLIGAGSPLLGAAGARTRTAPATRAAGGDERSEPAGVRPRAA